MTKAKKILSFALVLAMLCSCLFSCSITANATATGTQPTNAIKLTNKTWQTKSWTYNNYDTNCYNKIVVPSRGYINFVLSKPIDSEGEVFGYRLSLYDSKGNVIWEGAKSTETDIFNNYYTYKIGLAAGTYYMNIDPTFFVSYNSAPIETKYRYIYTQSSAWEIENNGSYEKATKLSCDKTYSAVIDEDTYDQDYYKVYLTKGKTYKIIIGKYISDLDITVYDPQREYVYFGPYSDNSEKVKGSVKTYTLKTTKTGYYYVTLSDWSDADIPYTILVQSPKISASKVKASLSTTAYTYDGKVKAPKVTAKYGSKTLKAGTDYTVKYASGRKTPGTYKVTLTFKGKYTGSKTLTFNIKPLKTSVLKLTAGKKSLKVYVSKKTSHVSGYQIQYSTSKSFKSYKTKTLSGYKNTSTTLKSLKAKRTYYVRVRTYKTVSGKKHYSLWSTYKYKKTK